MMQDAWPLILAGLSVSIYLKIDQVMLGEMVGESAVGVYATAVKISELWYFIPTAIAGSVFPKVVSSKENASAEVYRERMQAFYDAAALLSYLVIIPVMLSAGPLTTLLFGPEYSEAASILQVHIWAFLFVSLGVARGKWLIAENYTRFAMIAAILGAASNVGLNVLLIDDHGGIGAAWATVFSQCTTAYLVCLYIPLLRIQLSKAMVSPLRITNVYEDLNKIISKK